MIPSERALIKGIAYITNKIATMNKRPKHLIVSSILTWLLAAFSTLACLLWFRSFFPPLVHDTYIATFFLFALILGTSLFGLGHLVSSKIFKLPYCGVELALGTGALALFLSFYLKITLHPAGPLAILGLGMLTSLRFALGNQKNIRRALNQPALAVTVGVVAIILLTLSFTTYQDALLLFPNDFDSSLVHVTLPKIILDRGHYLNPDWLRGVWLPQLTMGLYIFILSISDQIYLKTLNVICFAQLALLFLKAAKRSTISMVPLTMFALLVTLPEFRQYIYQTNLDTVFALFSVSAFFMLLQHIRTPSTSSLMLIALLCGFSAGQKHFGLMYSVPILGFASLVVIFKERGLATAARRIPVIAGAGMLFCATFTPFYLHNLLAGNSLLFPFIGSKINTYGWDAMDLKQMIESTIPHWGHSKSLFGFFLLPAHLLQYPDKYQFSLTKSWVDWGVSVTISLVYLLTALALFVKPLRRAEVLIPSLAICINVAMWYQGSQVIRYLFPVLITTMLFFTSIMSSWLSSTPVRPRYRAVLSVALFISTLALVAKWIIPPIYPLAQSQADIDAWIGRYRGSESVALEWLSKNTPRDAHVLNIAGHQDMIYFPQLTLCGDFFGRYRYTRFLNTYIEFKSWPELREQLKTNQLSYILVNWGLFPPYSKRPINEAEWEKALPSSTRECLEHLYFDSKATDVYRVRDACWQ